VIRAKANLVPFNRALDKAKANMVPISIERAKQTAGLIVDYMGQNAPEDTAKFKRGIILAGRQIDAGSLPLPNLRASRYVNKLRSVLIRQMMYFERAIRRLELREREILDGMAARRAKKTDAYAKKQRAILAQKSKTGARTRAAIQRLESKQFKAKRLSIKPPKKK